jgi:hypothetical protein
MKAHQFRAWHDAETQNQRKADNKRTLERQYTYRPLLAPLRLPEAPVNAMTNAQHAALELARLGLK